MFIETTHFGAIEINEADILNFEEGIIGFEEVKKFVIIDSEDRESPFKWIQAVDKPELAFALVNPFKIKKDYDFDLTDEEVEYLGVNDASEVMVFSIVVVPEDIKKISMNLKAPLIINKPNNKAAQIILDTDKYTVRHFILDELQKQEV